MMRMIPPPPCLAILTVIGIVTAISGCSEHVQPVRNAEVSQNKIGRVDSGVKSVELQLARLDPADPAVARIFVTPETPDAMFELSPQLARQQVFLHLVQSNWRCDGWYLEVPEARINRRQPVADLLQAIADRQELQVMSVHNPVGLHYLFFKAAANDQLEKFRAALALTDPKIREQELRTSVVAYDPRLVRIVAPYFASRDTRALARELLLGLVGMAPTAVMLPDREALEFLEYEFEHGNRGEATASLGAIGGDGALRLLKTALADNDQDLRRSAVKSLRYIRDDGSLRALESAVGDKDVEVRKAVAEALSWKTANQARDALQKMIADEDPGVRTSAAAALAWHGAAAHPLLARTLQDENPGVRRATTVALGQVGDSEAVARLAAALHDEDYLVRESAAESLGVIGGPAVISVLADAIRDDAFDTRWAAAGALGRIHSGASLELLKVLIDDAEIDVQKRSVYQLGSFDAEVAFPLLKQATERYECCHIQSAAATALGEIGGDEAVTILSELLDRNTRRDYWDVRRTIAYALGAIGSDAAVRQLERILKSEVPRDDASDRENSLILATRLGAIDALGASGNSGAVSLLANELQHDDRQVRHDAINALARIGGADPRDLLLKHYEFHPEDREAVRQVVTHWSPGDAFGLPEE